MSRSEMHKTLSGITSAELQQAREDLVNESKKLQDVDDTLAPPRLSDIIDLKKTGEIAEKFRAGLDTVQDVLLVLVLKFGRATTMLRTVLLLLIPGIMVLIWCVVLLYGQKSETATLLENLSKLQKQQESIMLKQSKIEVQTQAAEAAARKAEAAAPKVIVDEKSGQAQLVIQTTESTGEKSVIVPPKASASASAPKATPVTKSETKKSGSVSIPLGF